MAPILPREAPRRDQRKARANYSAVAAAGSVQVNDLSLLFGVSTVTIRNDLAFLEKQGIAVRAYGGALICDSSTPGVEPSVEDKSALNTAVKHNIAKAAVKLIQPGHRVILDSGTTTYEIARLMRQHA